MVEIFIQLNGREGGLEVEEEEEEDELELDFDFEPP